MAIFSNNGTPPHLQKLANVAEVPVTQLYRDITNAIESILSFKIEHVDKDPFLIWTILMHPETCMETIGIFLAVCIGDRCLLL